MLHKADNPWMPSFKQQISEDTDQEILAKEKLRRRIQSILNKLTPQNFVTLVRQFKNLNIDTVEKLNLATDLTYEKSINEPLYSTPYANLCRHIGMIKVPVGNNKYYKFRDLILLKCQNEFEKNGSNGMKLEEMQKALAEAAPDRKKQLQFEIYVKERTRRHRKVGNIRFMGELFKSEILNDFIIHDCIQRLFQKGDEEALECLCKLLQTAGKKLNEGRMENSRENVELYFSEIQKIIDQHSTSSRIRFMLQDVIELKKNNWVPRRKELSPVTLSEIHKECEREARQGNQANRVSDRGICIELKLSGPELDENQAETKCKSLIEGFLHRNDLKATLKSIAETFSPATISIFLKSAVNIAVEGTNKARASIGQLLFTLLNEKLITFEEYKNGFNIVFLHIDEFKKDKPQIWKYLAEIMVPITIHDEYGINYFKNAFQSSLSPEDVDKLMTSIRQCTNEKMDEIP